MGDLAENDLDRLITITLAAPRLGMHPNTARRLARARMFPFQDGGPVPITVIGGRRMVSLRRVVEFVNSDRAAS